MRVEIPARGGGVRSDLRNRGPPRGEYPSPINRSSERMNDEPARQIESGYPGPIRRGLPGVKPRFYTPGEVADILRVTDHTLAIWRVKKKPQLDYVKVGSRVVYPVEAVEAFIARNTVNTASGT